MKSREIKKFQDVRNWAQSRGIYDFGDTKTQTVKMMEELGEFSSALVKQDKAKMIDALGDMQIVLISLAKLSGVRLETALDSAFGVVKDRNGNMVNGNFIKMEDKVRDNIEENIKNESDQAAQETNENLEQ